MKVIRVGLDVPVAQLFDYAATDASERDMGRRVRVPFGRRTAIGVIADVSDTAAVAAHRLKHASEIIRDAPGFSIDDLRLLRFASDYYHYPVGQVLTSALPLRLKRVKISVAPDVMHYILTPAGRAVSLTDLPPRVAVQRRLLDALRSRPSLAPSDAKRIAATAPQALKAFTERGWVTRAEPPVEVSATAAAEVTIKPTLTSSQTAAIAAIAAALDTFQPFLLHGVTGSGKTEVYLHIAEQVLERGRQALILVPEIALTPQLEATIQARFPHVRLVSLHSGLNESERLDHWLAAQSGKARLVLGTRLAVFTPMPDLGLIVVDEEHDASLKQSEGFCYSARDLAVVRASHRSIPVVLGSATPALESYYNAVNGRYVLLSLPDRINSRPPRIECIPMEARKADDGVAPRLLDAIGERLTRREQSLVFINRRGYAPVLLCHSCGWLSGCHRCSAQLVLHLAARELRCHHCGHRAPVPRACPQCGNAELRPIGQGTQRVEEALVRHFPEARILRIDRDSTRRKHAWSGMRNRIRAREVDILVGTQILAKGHDFPHLALVGVINADAMLYSADFRASERLYALLTQVAGRAGRGDAQGEVLIQTEFAEHPLYAALREQDFARFADTLLAQRRDAGFPPFVHQALLRAEAPQLATALEFLTRAKENAHGLSDRVDVFDPVPATLVRLAGRERAQLLVQSVRRPDLHGFLRAWRERLASEKSRAARWTLEVDPMEL